MAVTTAVYGRYRTATGTMAEVVGSLETEAVPMANVISVLNNGTNITAVYHK